MNEIRSNLLDISLKIYECYEKLKNLDYNGKKNTEEYKSKLVFLNRLIDLEKKLYDSISERELIQEILLSLTSKENINSLKSDINALINDKISLIKRRIIINLLNKKQKIDKSNLIRMAKEVDYELKMANSDMKNSYYEIINLLNLSDAIKKDFINSILLILNDNEDINKDNFFTILYKCSYLFSFCENQLLNNNFEIDKEIYWQSGIIIDLNQIDLEEVKSTKDLYGIEIINSFKDKEESDYIKIILRVALLFCSEDEIKSLKGNSKLENLIKINNHDKELVKILRLNSN